MTNRQLAWVLVVCGCGVSSDEAARESALLAPTIRSVRTDDGFRQIRQNAETQLVIRGDDLGQTTGVSVAALFVTLDAVGPHEVRATVFSDGSAPGLLDVTLSAPAGDTVAPGAVRLTPFVVSPASTGGHGTFQSPTNLCDPDLELATDQIELLAGTHTCDRFIFLNGGVIVEGDRQSPTIIDGNVHFDATFTGARPTTFRDLTFAPTNLATPSISGFDNDVLIERVNDAGGLFFSASSSAGTATIDRYTYEGSGTGVQLTRGAITRSTFRHCNEGVVATGQGVTVDHVTVTDCERGLVARGGPLVVSNARLIDNRVGMRIESHDIESQDMQSSLTDSVIRDDPSTPAGCVTGIEHFIDDLFVQRVTITGQSNAGIAIFQGSSDDNADFTGDGIEIVGGRVGLGIDGIDNQLSLHNSTIRGQTEACVSIGSLDSFMDLGNAFTPGNNTLSVRRGGFAIFNDRQSNQGIDRYVTAVGTSLNGQFFNGSVLEGPLTLPPYIKIVDGDSGFIF